MYYPNSFVLFHAVYASLVFVSLCFFGVEIRSFYKYCTFFDTNKVKFQKNFLFVETILITALILQSVDPFRMLFIPDVILLIAIELITVSLLTYLSLLSLSTLRTSFLLLTVAFPPWFSVVTYSVCSVMFVSAVTIDSIVFAVNREIYHTMLLLLYIVWELISIILLWYGYNVLLRETQVIMVNGGVKAFAAGDAAMSSRAQLKHRDRKPTNLNLLAGSVSPPIMVNCSSPPKNLSPRTAAAATTATSCVPLRIDVQKGFTAAAAASSSSSDWKFGSLARNSVSSNSNYTTVMAKVIRMRTLCTVVGVLCIVMWCFLISAAWVDVNAPPWRPDTADFSANLLSLIAPLCAGLGMIRLVFFHSSLLF